ncbi:type II toxin-antitoxin system PemK/MazF family toxin [Paenibacillus brevis]|uniref:Type II toxin-antitoxin system PemK/MazF family toxin n=1 Tax=Paenibacillus brevis TaxID=2841508 RepID=A0ABS6FLS4_9BACL|nr:type II toxin-antitoxin system PemK/MazF family toxin [Paenibacillus brevis]
MLLIPFPFSDLSSVKKRPVLVLSNDLYNHTSLDIIVAAITSNISMRDFSVLIAPDDLSEGRLKTESVVRVDKIYTFSKKIVTSQFGHLGNDKMNEIRARVNKLLT